MWSSALHARRHDSRSRFCVQSNAYRAGGVPTRLAESTNLHSDNKVMIVIMDGLRFDHGESTHPHALMKLVLRAHGRVWLAGCVCVCVCLFFVRW